MQDLDRTKGYSDDDRSSPEHEQPARTSAAPFELAPGVMVHQYELIRELGRGGMGRVMMARDTRLGRRVAIKFLSTASPGLAQRFVHEARTTAQLSHESIVIVHEVGEHAGVPFIVLEYLEGEPLTRQVREGGLPWPRVVELVVPVVRALVRAHAHGIIHRDLKPDNIVLTRDGAVKVLDFGIARAFAAVGDRPARSPTTTTELAQHDVRLTRDGALVGTLPYMSPEQCGMDTVDERSDLWAVGLILWELIAGRHPLAGLSAAPLLLNAAKLDESMPRIAEVVADLPTALERAIEACLAKRKDRRIASANDLLALLEPLLPGRLGRPLAEDEGPYIGLAAFQETDAARFFGRGRDIARVIARLSEQPLVALAGPSGVGKSSFVRAGVIPALKASSERWEAFTLRPGRDPIAAVASLLQQLTATGVIDVAARTAQHDALEAKLRAEPGYLGALLRALAGQKAARVVLFVDQREELYTLVPSEADRLAFAACLAGVADDPTTPLRVIVSIRSDFLDRIAESDRLVAEVTRGLIFLSPPDQGGLRAALVQPLELAGFRFESPAIVDDMLEALQTTPSALPLLQFVASRLWDTRDPRRKLITVGAYQAMGGIVGALSAHADDAIAGMPPEAQRLARLVFQQLVTPARTRAIVDASDLIALASSPADGQRVLDQLVLARLVLVQVRPDADGPSIELVHESLITGWPRLGRWLDESHEEWAFVAQLQTAAKQWDAAGRATGMVWRGDAADQARRFAARTERVLPERERAYLDAVIRIATRATRVRRIAVSVVIAVLSIVVVAALVAVAVIRAAKQDAQEAADRAQGESSKARDAEDIANRETENARAAEQVSAARLREIEEKNAAVGSLTQGLTASDAKLSAANTQLKKALATAEAERAKAVQNAAAAKRERDDARDKLKVLEKANRKF